MGAVISGAPEAQRFWLSKNNFWRMKDGHRQGGPRLFGGLEINIPALAGATYQLEQQLHPAITTSRFSKDGSTVTMRSLVAATELFLLVELAVEGKPVEVDTRLWAAPGRGSKEDLGRKDAVLWATKAFSEDVKFPTSAACALTVIGAKTTMPALEPMVEEVIPNPPPKRPPPRKAKSQPGPKFTLQPGEKVTVAVAVRSSYDDKDPLAAAQQMAIEFNEGKTKQLVIQHLKWWKEFWGRSMVEIGDPLIEQRYYLSSNTCGIQHIYPAAVRVGYDPAIILKELRGMIETKGGANGLTTGIVEGVENCGIVPNTINEMLCMSHGHVLRLFPVWPKDKDARFQNLRAWGAFLVSSELKGGEVKFVKILSEKGRDCTLVNPWPAKAVDVYRNGRKVETLKGDRITLKTEAGATTLLGPEGAAPPVEK